MSLRQSHHDRYNHHKRIYLLEDYLLKYSKYIANAVVIIHHLSKDSYLIFLDPYTLSINTKQMSTTT